MGAFTDGPVPGLWVVLGADYAGKSSVLTSVHRRTGWSAVSYDDAFLGDRHAPVRRLRDDVLAPAMGDAERYSGDFLLSVLQTAVVFLRDEALRHHDDRPVLVDSYYYKILAKCRLSGMDNAAFFTWWRSFPRPQGVVYLDVDPADAWRRAGCGRAVNRFEHYGDRPSWPAFRHFQTYLRSYLFAELRDVPTTVLPAGPDIDTTARRVEDTVRRSHVNPLDGAVPSGVVPAPGDR